MTLMRGYGENLKLQDWLNKKIFPFEAKLDGNAVYFQLCPDHIVCKEMAPQTVCAHKKHEEDQNLDQGVFHLFVHMIVLPLAYFFRAAG